MKTAHQNIQDNNLFKAAIAQIVEGMAPQIMISSFRTNPIDENEITGATIILRNEWMLSIITEFMGMCSGDYQDFEIAIRNPYGVYATGRVYSMMREDFRDRIAPDAFQAGYQSISDLQEVARFVANM